MATIYYLNWDTTADGSVERQFFQTLNFSGGDGVSTVPKDWYRHVAEVPDLHAERLWTAFQGRISDAENADELAAKEAFTDARERSMSVGDIIVSDDGSVNLAVSIGFSAVTWGDAPPLESLSE